jgi:ParB/RepB/Spo0J family partition protein
MAQLTQIEQIPIAQTKVSKFNVRRDIGDIAELVLSVRSVGVLEPVVARPVGKGFEVIIGSRRLAAARKAGLKTIPAIVRKLDDDEAILESLVENLQRGDLTEEEMAIAYQTLHKFDPKRWNLEKFGQRIGKSTGWVSTMLSAFQSLKKLEEAGLVKGMASYPNEDERKRGIAPTTHLVRIEGAVKSLTKSGAISEEEVDEKRVEIAKATLGLSQDDALRVIDRVKMYPEKKISEVKEEALAEGVGVALRTYLPPKVARQIEERTGRRVEEAITEVIERGIQTIPASTEEKAQMKHWADELTQDPLSIQVANWWKWNRQRIDGKFDFFTTHYSGKDLDTFVETLKANGVKTLIDVRDTPFSQFRPEFNKENLSKTLTAKGLTYEHHPELGVPREQRDKLAKSGNWSTFFDWYDKNVAPKVGSVKGGQKPIAFMCVEKDPQKCHRHRIALALEKTGLRSLDI